jgi:hypothetical protein
MCLVVIMTLSVLQLAFQRFYSQSRAAASPQFPTGFVAAAPFSTPAAGIR